MLQALLAKDDSFLRGRSPTEGQGCVVRDVEQSANVQRLVTMLRTYKECLARIRNEEYDPSIKGIFADVGGEHVNTHS